MPLLCVHVFHSTFSTQCILGIEACIKPPLGARGNHQVKELKGWRYSYRPFRESGRRRVLRGLGKDCTCTFYLDFADG